ncbi:MAG: hypothetical protein IIB54_15705 [Planctomycetes bacterium]|nr:hypothetical protein [Planctomycetota bacterium]
MTSSTEPSINPSELVRPSVGSLLNGIIDYAGLFPPAKLDMPHAVEKYATHAASDESWMLSRLILPVSKMDEFDVAAKAFLPNDLEEDPWAISALTVPAGDANFEADIKRIETFNNHHANPENGLALVDVIELKGDDARKIDDCLDLIPDELFPFFELPIAADPRGLIATLVGCEAGAKVRTGGVTAELYPSLENLARFIMACASTGMPFKATAGLHHPLRHYSEAVQITEHGFLNVFIAAALANIKHINEDEILAVLEETDPEAFTFEHETLTWGDHVLTLDEIDETRSYFAISFGACSFDEPREDLRQLGLL